MKIVKQPKDPGKQNRLSKLVKKLQELIVVSAERGTAAHEVELAIWRQVPKLGCAHGVAFAERSEMAE